MHNRMRFAFFGNQSKGQPTLSEIKVIVSGLEKSSKIITSKNLFQFENTGGD